MKLGFTGTQKGMTPAQKGQFVDHVMQLEEDYRITQFRHGDCIGADAEAHQMIRDNLDHVPIIGHPPTNESKRAFCEFDLEMAPFPYLVHNKMIVNNSGFMIATPGEMAEQLRSGTWSTIRYARTRLIRPRVVIIYPDGTIGE